MEISNDELIALPVKVKVISTQSEEIIDQPLVPKSKSDFKTKEEKQERLATLAEDTRRRLRRSATDIYCIGLNLLEAQNIIQYGQFLPWLRREFGMSKTSAYEFINVAKAFESKFPIIGNLINNITPTALCKVASPSIPEAARDEAIYLVKTGETVDPEVAKNLIKKYKTPKGVKEQQQKNSITSLQSDTNQVEALALLNTEVVQMEQISSNSIPLSSVPQQDEIQKLVMERDTYKGRLEVLQIVNEQLKHDFARLRSELILLQMNKN